MARSGMAQLLSAPVCRQIVVPLSRVSVNVARSTGDVRAGREHESSPTFHNGDIASHHSARPRASR
jgi:hypothetical protein